MTIAQASVLGSNMPRPRFTNQSTTHNPQIAHNHKAVMLMMMISCLSYRDSRTKVYDYFACDIRIISLHIKSSVPVAISR